MMSAADVQRVAIVGAGIAGAALARTLSRSGLEVDVYESASSPLERTGGVFTYSNLARVRLREMGVDVGPMSIGTVPPSADSDGVPRGGMTNWQLLQHALLDGLPAERVRVHGGKRVTTLTTDETGLPEVLFDDGTSATAHIVCGADGIRSTIRGFVEPGRRLGYRGYVLWSGRIREEDLGPTRLDQRQYGTAIPHGGGMAFKALPVRREDGGVDYEWSLMLNVPWAFVGPLRPDGTPDKLFVPASEVPAETQDWVRRNAERLLTPHHPALAAMVTRTGSISAHPMMTAGSPKKFYAQFGSGAAVLSGSALQVVLQFSGQGIAASLTQAAGLRFELAHAKQKGTSLRDALDMWSRATDVWLGDEANPALAVQRAAGLGTGKWGSVEPAPGPLLGTGGLADSHTPDGPF
jgi:2-polyprenyl-6-methoxyphenol hydroxylase-like FAD-dependent oxidoreductase